MLGLESRVFSPPNAFLPGRGFSAFGTSDDVWRALRCRAAESGLLLLFLPSFSFLLLGAIACGIAVVVSVAV
jgi:hypothetical protein